MKNLTFKKHLNRMGYDDNDIAILNSDTLIEMGEEYAKRAAKDFKVWCCEQVIAGRNVMQLWDEYVMSNGSSISHKF
jgi:hypothetical protein